jgi:hypothetical protein
MLFSFCVTCPSYRSLLNIALQTTTWRSKVFTAVWSFERDSSVFLVNTYETVRCHNPEDHSLKIEGTNYGAPVPII